VPLDLVEPIAEHLVVVIKVETQLLLALVSKPLQHLAVEAELMQIVVIREAPEVQPAVVVAAELVLALDLLRVNLAFMVKEIKVVVVP
jgi:hypothetical protein